MYILTMVFLNTNGPDLTFYLSSHFYGTAFYEPYQVVSHMFMHSQFDFFHLLFNMFGLVIFGSILEKLWGAQRFFIFYLACGIGAFVIENIVKGFEISQVKQALEASGINVLAFDNLIQNSRYMTELEFKDSQALLFEGKPFIPEIQQYYNLSFSSGVGASGAIYGLFAAFAFLFPNTELYLMFIPIPIKAKFLIGALVLFEVYRMYSPSVHDNVNHLAHIGGASIGILYVLYIRYVNKKDFY